MAKAHTPTARPPRWRRRSRDWALATPTRGSWPVFPAIRAGSCLQTRSRTTRPSIAGSRQRGCTAAGSNAVGASFLTSWLAGVIVAPLTRAIIRERRAWSVAAGDLLVHHHPEGWFDGIAVCVPKVVMLPGDQDSKHGDAVVAADLGALHGWAARELAATLATILGAIRRRARLGQPAMWGGVADSAAFAAVSDAVARGDDPEAALRRGYGTRRCDRGTGAATARSPVHCSDRLVGWGHSRDRQGHVLPLVSDAGRPGPVRRGLLRLLSAPRPRGSAAALGAEA